MKVVSSDPYDGSNGATYAALSRDINVGAGGTVLVFSLTLCVLWDINEGDAVGLEVGCPTVGDAVGNIVGETVGNPVGAAVGVVGAELGLTVGDSEGSGYGVDIMDKVVFTFKCTRK